MSENHHPSGTTNGKAETLQQIDQSWNSFLAALDGLPTDAAAEPGACGEWSVKDVVGHLAFWASHAGPIATRQVAALDQPLAEEDGESEGETDYQRINEEVAAKNADRSYDELTRELHQTHEQMVETLRALPSLDPDWVAGNTFAHYDEHAAEIRQWRERRGA